MMKKTKQPSELTDWPAMTDSRLSALFVAELLRAQAGEEHCPICRRGRIAETEITRRDEHTLQLLFRCTCCGRYVTYYPDDACK